MLSSFGAPGRRKILVIVSSSVRRACSRGLMGVVPSSVAVGAGTVKVAATATSSSRRSFSWRENGRWYIGQEPSPLPQLGSGATKAAIRE